MPVIHGVSEKAFKKVAKRLHRLLHPLMETPQPSLTLVQTQDLLSQAMGLGPMAMAAQHWPNPVAAMPEVRPSNAAVSSPALSLAEARRALQAQLNVPAAHIRITERTVDGSPGLRVTLAHTAAAWAHRVPPTQAGYPVECEILGALPQKKKSGDQNDLLTLEDEQAWQAVPALFRDSRSEGQRRRDHLKQWIEKDDLFRGALTAADQGVEALRAWILQHPEITESVQTEDFEVYTRGDSVTHFFLVAVPQRMDLLTVWMKQTNFSGLAGLWFYHYAILWDHPHGAELLAFVADKDLDMVMHDHIHSLKHHKDERWPTASERRQRVLPLLNAFSLRLTHPTPAQQVTWENLLKGVQRYWDQCAPQEVKDELNAREQAQWERLPSTWFTHYNEHTFSATIKRLLITEYASLPPLWRSALEALAAADAREAKFGYKVSKRTIHKPWRHWLQAHQEEAPRVSGPRVGPEGKLTPSVQLQSLVYYGRYETWLEVGLPSFYGAGVAGLNELLARNPATPSDPS